MKKLKIYVLYGGFSSERSISLKTGKAVYENLVQWKDYEVKLVDIKRNNWLKQILKLKKEKVDIVFIALHGKFGEDGKLQAILESLGIKYTGAGVLPSAIAMNKHFTKLLLKSNNIPTPEWKLIKNIDDLENLNITYPVVVKPTEEGSTIGLSVVENKTKLLPAVKLALKYSDTAIVEKFIHGKEITVPVLGGKILPLIEIIPKCNKYYDFKSKYQVGGSEHLIPPKIDKKIYKKIVNIAKKVVNLLGCEILCRIDMILDEKNEIPYVLEVNTIPGMTPTSLLPEAAKSYGISFPQLVREIVNLSLKKYD